MSKPLIVYWSSNSGGTKRVAEALDVDTLPLHEAKQIEQPYILMTPTFDQPRGGFTPAPVTRFLKDKAHLMVGVIGTGNTNFLHHYCQAAKDISEEHGVPTLWRMDIMGTERDYHIVNDGIKQHWAKLVDMRGLNKGEQ